MIREVKVINWIPKVPFILVVSLLAISCASMEHRWQEAVVLDSIEGYQEFLNKYPSSNRASQARLRIQALRFEQALKLNTIEAYEEFLQEYPDGEQADQALLEIEKLRLEQATALNTVEAYKEFLQEYPYGEMADQARLEIEKLRLEQATALNTIEAYEQFLQEYPDGEQADQARLEIEKFESEQATALNTIDAYEEFLQEYSDGEQAGTIRTRLFALLQDVEDSIITSIQSHGIGNRFVIPDIQPDQESCTGSITVEEIPGTSGIVNLVSLFPKDALEFEFNFDGAMNPTKCFGPGSIWRFIGKVEFLGISMEGSRNDPLSFMFHEKGLVYLHGGGLVDLKDGDHVEFR